MLPSLRSYYIFGSMNQFDDYSVARNNYTNVSLYVIGCGCDLLCGLLQHSHAASTDKSFPRNEEKRNGDKGRSGIKEGGE
jgi:hypothetical protein